MTAMKILLFCLSGLLATLQTGTADAKVVQSWLAVRRSVTFYEAEKLCQSMGGVIADIEDRATEVSVQDYIGTTADLEDNERRREFWVGRNDIAHEGIFVTANGTHSSNFGWCVSQPTNGEGENCAYYYMNYLCHYDVICEALMYFICANVPVVY